MYQKTVQEGVDADIRKKMIEEFQQKFERDYKDIVLAEPENLQNMGRLLKSEREMVRDRALFTSNHGQLAMSKHAAKKLFVFLVLFLG